MIGEWVAVVVAVVWVVCLLRIVGDIGSTDVRLWPYLVIAGTFVAVVATCIFVIIKKWPGAP
jgi:hypothetical protein